MKSILIRLYQVLNLKTIILQYKRIEMLLQPGRSGSKSKDNYITVQADRNVIKTR